MELAIPIDTLCRVIVRAREIEAQVPAIETDGDANPEDSDDPFAVLEDEANTGVEEEMAAQLDDLADDELAEMLSLAFIGRGSYEASEWDEAIEEAGASDREAIKAQLLEMPMLAAYLEAGLAAFDLDCDEAGQQA